MMRLIVPVVMMFVFATTVAAQVAPPIPPNPPLPKEQVMEPEGPAEEPLKLAEKALANAKSASEGLAMNDTGKTTQRAQQNTLKAIDDLLKNQTPPPPMGGGGGGDSNNPPPPMGGDQPPPMGGGQSGGKPPPQGGQQGKKPPPSGGNQPMPMGGNQPMPMGGNQPMPMGGNQPMPMGVGQQKPMGGANPGQGSATSPPGLPLDDKVTKEIWGHLPPQLRQKMNQYYQERFMPKYADLLKQYYSSLAEKEKGKK